jgi:hypothetical protein
MNPFKCLTLSLLLSLTAISFAQTNKFDIGVDAGPGLIYMYGNDIITKYNQPSVGVSADISFQYNINKIFSLKTMLSYDLKGNQATVYFTNQNGVNTGEKGTIHSYLDYLTLPILAKATFGRKIRFFVNAGPYISALVKTSNNYNNVAYVNGSLKPIDSGIQAGLGLTVPIKQYFELSIEDRNSVGLLNISRQPVINNGTVKTFSSALLVGFNYKFGKGQTKVKQAI